MVGSALIVYVARRYVIVVLDAVENLLIVGRTEYTCFSNITLRACPWAKGIKFCVEDH